MKRSIGGGGVESASRRQRYRRIAAIGDVKMKS